MGVNWYVLIIRWTISIGKGEYHGLTLVTIAESVPEPTSLLGLFIFAGAGVIAIKRR